MYHKPNEYRHHTVTWPSWVRLLFRTPYVSIRKTFHFHLPIFYKTLNRDSTCMYKSARVEFVRQHQRQHKNNHEIWEHYTARAGHGKFVGQPRVSPMLHIITQNWYLRHQIDRYRYRHGEQYSQTKNESIWKQKKDPDD